MADTQERTKRLHGAIKELVTHLESRADLSSQAIELAASNQHVSTNELLRTLVEYAAAHLGCIEPKP